MVLFAYTTTITTNPDRAWCFFHGLLRQFRAVDQWPHMITSPQWMRAKPSFTAKCFGEYTLVVLNTLAPELTNESRCFPLRKKRDLICIQISGNLVNQNYTICVSLGVKPSPKQCCFCWLPTFVKYGNLMLPVFVQLYYYCVYVPQCQSKNFFFLPLLVLYPN